MIGSALAHLLQLQLKLQLVRYLIDHFTNQRTNLTEQNLALQTDLTAAAERRLIIPFITYLMNHVLGAPHLVHIIADTFYGDFRNAALILSLRSEWLQDIAGYHGAARGRGDPGGRGGSCGPRDRGGGGARTRRTSRGVQTGHRRRRRTA